jgi:putative sterol carrier protein
MQTLTGRPTNRDSILPHLENLWAQYDAIFDSLSAADWRRRHGRDWVIADVPYHLFYFDRDLLLEPLQRGRDVPDEVIRGVPRTLGELNAWNARKFAERPADEVPERSLARWREVRHALQEMLREVDGADRQASSAESSGRPIFVPLMGSGWMPLRSALEMDLAHHWSHYTQLRLYLARSGPLESPEVRHIGLAFYMGFMQHVVRADAARKPFTLVMDFTGPGGGAWSFQVAGGRCTIAEQRVEPADLVMSQAPETFVKSHARMHNPMLAMFMGHIKVRGLRQMGTFGKLMPPPSEDMSMEANVQAPAS